MSIFVVAKSAIFRETPKLTIAKFGMKKLALLGFFPLTDSMAPLSAVLELFAFKLPSLRFSGLGNHFKPKGLLSTVDRSMPGLVDNIAQSSAYFQFSSAFRRLNKEDVYNTKTLTKHNIRATMITLSKH